MRGSIHGQPAPRNGRWCESARLENLTSLSTLVERLTALESGAPARRPDAGTARMKPSAPEALPAPAAPALSRTVQARPAVPRPRVPVSSPVEPRTESSPHPAPVSIAGRTTTECCAPLPRFHRRSRSFRAGFSRFARRISASVESPGPEREQTPPITGSGERPTLMKADGGNSAVATAVREEPATEAEAADGRRSSRDALPRCAGPRISTPSESFGLTW